ncbi:MAG TPA: ABC transporter permease subunit [Thermoanaerobacterales bacterium]|nr:ABC transporter permease subunit [Thermoanaerobacterales bacterium]
MRKNINHLITACALIILWEILAKTGWYPRLLFPQISDILHSFVFNKQEITHRVLYSVTLICKGFLFSLIVAFTISSLATFNSFISNVLTTLMATMHPLPAIAILPIVLLWFGTGEKSILAIIIFSSIWPLTANIYNGFRSVPATQMEVGKNLGLKGTSLVLKVMTPASLPQIITGIRIGWARAWQASVAAEMVFGASGGEGGIGWFLYKKRFMMEIPGVFAGLLVIILIGIIVENLFLSQVENHTIRKWKITTD